MICTSIEQSKHLLRLGLDPKTADVWWTDRFVYFAPTPQIGVGDKKDLLVSYAWSTDDVPAWSLSALLEVMRKLNVVVTLQVTEMATWLRIKDLGFIWHKDIHVQNPMDAVYGGMLWLFEQGLIKKGGQDE